MARITRQPGQAVTASQGRRESAPSVDEDIKRVAYELWERRGRRHGQDQRDWFEAERIVRERRAEQRRGDGAEQFSFGRRFR